MDFCVCCGQYVPEGRMVCPECEYKAEALAKDMEERNQQILPKAKGNVDEML